MQKNELESLLSLDKGQDNNIDNILHELDSVITENCGKISDEASGVYKKFQPMKQDAPDSMKIVLFDTIKNFALEEEAKGNYVSELLLFRFLLVKSELNAKDYLLMAKSVCNIDKLQNSLIDKIISLYKEKEENKLLVYIELSDFYKSIGDYKTAIKYYEEFLKIDKTKAVVCNITADLYSKAYPNQYLEREIELYEQSYKIQPNRLTLHGLAFNYEKLGNNEKADYYYKKLLEDNPTENDLYNYGGFLIHCGDFINGHKYFRHRFNIDDINLKYPVNDSEEEHWDFQTNLKDKKLLIHYEQGFGDTIMYSRFVPDMKQFTKKIIFVVQDELFDLINEAKIFDDIKVATEKKLPEYDYSMALLDCPYALNINPEKIPYAQGYLSVTDLQIKNYKDKYIKDNNKIKIGISTSGASDANYNDRNLDISQLKFLADKKNIELYSLEKESKNTAEWLIPLGDTFKTFTDSACAVKNMDLIISTDNVILNLAGALGVNTIGLFNKQTNYRWYKTTGNDTGWYKSVKPLQNKTQNDWSETLIELNNIVSQLI